MVLILTLAHLLMMPPAVFLGTANDAGYPLGHLQPLGGHQPPGKVEERDDLPTAEEFWNKYVKPSKAVIFRGLAKKSPLFTKWTDEYIKTNFGNLEIRLEGKKEKSSGIPKGAKGIGRDTLENFINTYHKEGQNKYAVTELPTPMYKDLMVPPFLGCGTFADRLVEIDLWMSGGGSSSILHKDAYNALNCLFNGTKEWKLIEYKYEKKIYKFWEPENEVGGFSRINPEKVDLFKYPTVAEVPWSYLTVNAGDCLFLPKSMYHQVKSFGTHNLAISILFSRFDDVERLNFSDCRQQKFKPLSDFDVDWQYPGYGVMSMGNSDLEYITRTDMLERLKYKELSPDGLLEHFRTVRTYIAMNRTSSALEEKISKFYDILGLKRGDEVMEHHLQNLNKTRLRLLAELFASIEPSNTYQFEYNYIHPKDIVKEVAIALERGGVVRDDFMQAYVTKLGGTEEFGRKLFNELGGEGMDAISKDTLIQNIEKALSPYLTWQSLKIERPEGEKHESDAYEDDEGKDDTDDQNSPENIVSQLSSAAGLKEENDNEEETSSNEGEDSEDEEEKEQSRDSLAGRDSRKEKGTPEDDDGKDSEENTSGDETDEPENEDEDEDTNDSTEEDSTDEQDEPEEDTDNEDAEGTTMKEGESKKENILANTSINNVNSVNDETQSKDSLNVATTVKEEL